MEHIKFGTVLGVDKRPYKTRSGAVAGLEYLLDEAVAHALEVVKENPDIDDEVAGEVADCIGHAAVKYADLSHNRTSDYVFSLSKMVENKGDTATYMQYSYARTRSVLTRAGLTEEQVLESFSGFKFEEEAERNLALCILQLPEAVEEVVEEYYPNLLANYLYKLATHYATFWDRCPMLKDGVAEELKFSRLTLSILAGRVLKLGLGLLGIGVVQKM